MSFVFLPAEPPVIDYCIVCGRELEPNPKIGYCSDECYQTDLSYQLRHHPDFFMPYVPLQVSRLVFEPDVPK